MRAIAMFLVASLAVACGDSASNGGGSADGGGSSDGGAPATGGQSAGGQSAGGQSAGGSQPTFTSKTIDFDDLTFDDDVTNQYAIVATFSILGDGAVKVADYDWAYITAVVSSEPNWICPGDVCGGCCNADMAIDFASPAYNLHFIGVGVDSAGKVAEVHVFSGDGTMQTVDVIGNGADDNPPIVDLSAYEGVTRVELVSITDAAGMGWDDFEFEVVD